MRRPRPAGFALVLLGLGAVSGFIVCLMVNGHVAAGTAAVICLSIGLGLVLTLGSETKP